MLSLEEWITSFRLTSFIFYSKSQSDYNCNWTIFIPKYNVILWTWEPTGFQSRWERQKFPFAWIRKDYLQADLEELHPESYKNGKTSPQHPHTKNLSQMSSWTRQISPGLGPSPTYPSLIYLLLLPTPLNCIVLCLHFHGSFLAFPPTSSFCSPTCGHIFWASLKASFRLNTLHPHRCPLSHWEKIDI